MKTIKTFILVAAAALLGCDAATPPDISYAPLTNEGLKDPDNPRKVFRVDMAEVEHRYPLKPADLLKITPDNIRDLEQEQIDQIYGRITAGPIPAGVYEGQLFFPRGVDGEARLAEIIGGLPGRIVDKKVNLTELIGASLWKGKVFYRDERVLRNQIEDLRTLTPLLGDSSDGIETIEVPRRGFLGKFFDTRVWLLFPAKLYCGQSLLDGRRESVIIDYAYSDELPGYRERPDSLASRNALGVRDEIRMVRPGFYLGRAYSNRVFLLNFTLYNREVAERDTPAFLETGTIAEDCWIGEQLRTASLP